MQSLKNVKKTALVFFFLRKPCFILQILTENLTLRSFLLSKYTKGSYRDATLTPGLRRVSARPTCIIAVPALSRRQDKDLIALRLMAHIQRTWESVIANCHPLELTHL